MKDWLAKNALRVVLILLAVAAVAVVLTLRSCNEARTAKTTEKVATGQAGAATASGKDAVETVGNRADSDAAADTVTRENANAIDKAEGASAPVAPAARDAGLRSLCRRASYRGNPKCVQFANP